MRARHVVVYTRKRTFPLPFDLSQKGRDREDADGNGISDGPYDYTYNARNQLVSINAAPAAPVIAGIPVRTGAAGTYIEVLGAHFVSGATTVDFNGIAAPSVLVFNSGTIAIAELPSGNINGPVTVTTAQGTATSSDDFGSISSTLSVSGVWPAVMAPGASFEVLGNGFVAGQTQVTVNGTPAASVTVSNAGCLGSRSPRMPCPVRLDGPPRSLEQSWAAYTRSAGRLIRPRIRWLYDPGGKWISHGFTLMSFSDLQYVLEAYDAAALQRMVKLAYEIRVHRVAPADIHHFMKQHPQWSTQPLDGREFTFSPVRERLSVNGLWHLPKTRKDFTIPVWTAPSSRSRPANRERERVDGR